MKEVEIDGRKKKIASTVDAVGLFCPMPIVHLGLALEALDSNQVVEILADDSGFGEDVVNWCKETKNPLLFIRRNEESIFVAYVEKA